MRILKYFLYIAVGFTILECMTADKSERNFSAHKAANELPTRVVLKKKIAPNKETKLNISVEVLDTEADWSDAVLSNFLVQDDRSILLRLSSNYYLVFVRIRNNNSVREVLQLSSLEFEHEGEPFRPEAWENYPKNISCLNWKGNIKNLYNAGVLTLTTVFIVGVLAACAKEGKCEGIQHIEKALNLASSGETNVSKVISNPLFTTNLEFWNEKDPWVMNPGTNKEFFLLYPKSWSQNLGTKALLSPNCF
ncbi:hypothetical protein EHQ53_07780 [Leptospira langatensis]|uniref:Uncharacterized protein n=1 Tax=Leptospira langatensis TaxID=2484983 RepID=A0A5F1ZU66_9LEPT|nr:hypothetical protein [Leptospira langatensis]TGK01461.1 hypothetical protein EHO57_11090 [Leptospira langatensis]TGL42089.1 hypothetical protein EHQ53_07780 [Leptospira langatensis]